MAATSGSKVRDSREISPSALIPISPTIHAGLRDRLTTDIGNPTALFWFPGVFSTEKRRERITAANSFVVVLPTEPATAARRKPASFFIAPARRRSASRGLATSSTG